MLSALRKRLSYANVTATLAVFFAMSGGAYAASHYLLTSTKQIKPSVLAQLRGKSGPAGANGANGAAGPAGPQGPAGARGENGANGSNGTNGTSVTSVESKAKIGPCAAGGSEFKAGGATTYACNGEKGKEGTFGGQVLPAGKTLTGVYAASSYSEKGFEEGGGAVSTGVSFALPVEVAATELHAHYIKENETPPPGCSGNVSEPAAAEGNLCAFGNGEPLNILKENITIQPEGAVAPGPSSRWIGFLVRGLAAEKGNMVIEGTWAVTG